MKQQQLVCCFSPSVDAQGEFLDAKIIPQTPAMCVAVVHQTADKQLTIMAGSTAKLSSSTA